MADARDQDSNWESFYEIMVLTHNAGDYDSSARIAYMHLANPNLPLVYRIRTHMLLGMHRNDEVDFLMHAEEAFKLFNDAELHKTLPHIPGLEKEVVAVYDEAERYNLLKQGGVSAPDEADVDSDEAKAAVAKVKAEERKAKAESDKAKSGTASPSKIDIF